MSFEDLKQKAREAKTLNELFELWKHAHEAEENYNVTTVQTIEQNLYQMDLYLKLSIKVPK